MSLTYFTVTGRLQAVTSDTSGDIDGTPDTENITSFVIFTPNINQVYDTDDETIYRLQPIRARTNLDLGEVLNIDGTPVSLVANTTNLDVETLTYTVTFTNVNYDEADRTITPFTFTAPTDTTPIDLATVERITP